MSLAFLAPRPLVPPRCVGVSVIFGKVLQRAQQVQEPARLLLRRLLLLGWHQVLSRQRVQASTASPPAGTLAAFALVVAAGSALMHRPLGPSSPVVVAA